MRVFVGADHAGFELKEKIKDFLKKRNVDVEDCGALNFEKDDDYPDYVQKVAISVSKDPENRGLFFGGSGEGEAIAANKINGIRCAVYYGPQSPIASVDIIGRISSDPHEIVKLSREHNDSNILSIGARFVSEEDAKVAVALFLSTDFPADERHVRRIKKIKDLES